MSDLMPADRARRNGKSTIGALLVRWRRDERAAPGHVRRITFNEKGQPIQWEPGYLYVLTDQDAGAVLRVELAQ